jgi:hypothetical protein
MGHFWCPQNFCAKKKLIINQLSLFFDFFFSKCLVAWWVNYTFAAAFEKAYFSEPIF